MYPRQNEGGGNQKVKDFKEGGVPSTGRKEQVQVDRRAIWKHLCYHLNTQHPMIDIN